ncbi:MAG: hypothetical protein UW85_C0006G0019, partial [Parcubacteria group bacterium GW2011_GWA1_Parcubacteria_45_10]
MPITKSAKKALRQNRTRKKRNVAKKDKVRSLKKEIVKALNLKDTEAAKKKISELYRALDKA